MGNYEALQRAEKERRLKVSGENAEPVAALDWDSTPKTAPPAPADKPGLFKRLFSRKEKARKRRSVEAQDANELNKRRISILRPESYIAEQFRSLRGRIEAISSQRPIRSIGVTSANPGEGKSTAAINLAIVTSMSIDRSVIIVDCDLRRPTLHRSLGLTPKVGLGEVLEGKATVDDAIIEVEDTRLHAIPVHGQPSNPSELLASPEMVQMMEVLNSRYDRVILDTPASLGLPDAKIVSDLCDGLVLVVRAGVTPREEVDAVLEIIDRRKILGLVLNDADVERESYGYY